MAAEDSSADPPPIIGDRRDDAAAGEREGEGETGDGEALDRLLRGRVESDEHGECTLGTEEHTDYVRPIAEGALHREARSNCRNASDAVLQSGRADRDAPESPNPTPNARPPSVRTDGPRLRSRNGASALIPEPRR